ncbi:hypothetical protein [Actinoalloteichus hymeniacidonis]|uniref:Uncharacterized protein n=1 Tax=Actinoalloteichus hymeniacidonis TaxID=340345 RepID=A0AAC9HR90_9PSEU|nr:hypothetical protein [Actinoalloteichus hymeniacidonis]AOS63501.1 hypothetical protein TL08_13435 [Actinoalloteichus hymeniacidonis]MBB5908455.1 hypothetical protein [Actinoalloteichus hymeniacidonis]
MRLVQRVGVIAVATLAALAGTVIGTAPVPAEAQACTASTGVVVVVDFGALGGSAVSRCVPGTPETGYAALQEAGFRLAGTAHDGAGFICRIDGRPGPEQEACDDTPSGDAYWSYWVDEPGGNGWSYSSRGALASYPEVDRIEGWSFGAGDPPGLTGAAARSHFTGAEPPEEGPGAPDADRPGTPDRPSPGDPAAPPEEPRTPDQAQLPDAPNSDQNGDRADVDSSDAPESASQDPSAGQEAESPGSASQDGGQQVAGEAAEETAGGVPWATLIAFAAIWVLGIAAGIAARRRRRRAE